MRVRTTLLPWNLSLLILSFIALGHDKAQSIIDQITSAFESGQGPPPGGFGFGPQHLAQPPAPPFGGPMGFGGPPGFGGRESSRLIHRVPYLHKFS